MATWEEMAEDCGRAAQDLLLAGRYRSSISRAYYAVYCAVTSRFAGRMDFGYDGNNPAHEALENLAVSNLRWRSDEYRRKMQRALRRLRYARIEADYVPGVTIDRQTALNAFRNMESLRQILEEGLK